MGADNVGLVTIFVYSPVNVNSVQREAQPFRKSRPAALAVGDVKNGSIVR